MCCCELTPYTLVNNSVLTRLQKQDSDADRSQVAAGREFQAADSETVWSVAWQLNVRNY